MPSLDLALWLAIIGAEAVCMTLLVYRRVYRTLPAFTLYLGWTILSDIILTTIQRHYAPHNFQFFIYGTFIDVTLQFAVLVELAWSVLRPLRSALPRWTIFAIALFVLAAGALVWPIAGITQIRTLTPQWHLYLHLQQSATILRILFFMGLAAGSQLLSLGWRDRELQVASGLGFYSLVSLGAQVLHAQVPTAMHYHWVDQLVTGSYLCSLAYWLVCFAQKEAPRHDFSPQMQSFLLKVAGVSRTNRIAIENRSLHGDHQP